MTAGEQAAKSPLMAEQKQGWFQRLTSGLSRSTREMTEQVTSVLVKKPLDQEQLDQLEEMLIEADLGPHAAARITEAFGKARFGKSSTEEEVKEALAEAVAAELVPRRWRRRFIEDKAVDQRQPAVAQVGLEQGQRRVALQGQLVDAVGGRRAAVFR